MSNSEPYEIRSNDRITAVGKTGSGKTAAIKHLVWDQFKTDDAVLLVFYDMTGEEESSLNAPVLRTLDEVEEAIYPADPDEKLTTLVYSPEVPTYESFEDLCRMVYEHGNAHLIADELMMVYRDGNSVRPTTDHHLKILTNGRKKGVGMSGATQRPVNVPLESLSEAEHIFTFKLKLGTDRDRMKQIIGEPAADAMELHSYRYIYDHDKLDEPRQCQPLQID